MQLTCKRPGNGLIPGRLKLPLLMVGTNLVSGVFRTTAQLCHLLGLAA
jgi:hypothetical protein